jgi:hypothetical protein
MIHKLSDYTQEEIDAVILQLDLESWGNRKLTGDQLLKCINTLNGQSIILKIRVKNLGKAIWDSLRIKWGKK